LDKVQFRAQYYNDPSDPDSRPIDYDKFQYFEKKLLKQSNGYWEIRGERLNLVASVDFAYSTRKTADFTAIVVIGVDADNNIYVLDIERFRTSDISEYFNRILGLYNRWGFRKLIAEVTAAQQAIVKSLKQDYIATHGLALKVEEVRPTRNQGSKEERMEAILTPRYDNLQVYHYRGGNTQVLEEELVQQNPAHDDVKDALASAIDNAVKPSKFMRRRNTDENKVVFHPRFGGRAF
jgi:predicted phage terminase large subunit-like protein